jgi:hypothetical protein
MARHLSNPGRRASRDMRADLDRVASQERARRTELVPLA